MQKDSRTPTGRRWLFRIVLTLVSGMVLLSAIWGYWYYEAVRRCENAIAAMRSRGERISWHDVKLEEVPDGQNAVWYLQRAQSAFVASPASTAFPITNLAASEREVAANEKAFDLLRKSRACQYVSWGAQRDAMGYPPIPQLTNAASLTRTLRAKVLSLHAKGDDREAVECWRDGEAASRTIGTKSWYLIMALISMITEGINTNGLEQIAPDLIIGGPGGLSPDEVRALITQISEDATLRETVAQGFLGERTNMTTAYLDAGRNVPSLLRPAMLLSFHKGWGLMDDAVESVRHYRPMPPLSVNTADRVLGIFPQFTNAGADVHNGILHRRLTAMILAVRLYHAERGRYPATLQDLIPAYLAQPPMDPRTADLRPLGYLLADHGNRPVVYSSRGELAEGQLLQQLPAVRSTAESLMVNLSVLTPVPSVQEVFFLDASGWRAKSTQETVEDQVKQPDAPKSQQGNQGGQQ